MGQEDLDGGRERTEKCVKKRERENKGGGIGGKEWEIGGNRESKTVKYVLVKEEV